MSLRVNALGLVAFAGGHSLHDNLGSLAQNYITEYLPLFAGHLIPTDRIAEPVPGFVVYNVSDAIKTRGISPWFSRWLLAQDPTPSSTVLNIKISPDTKNRILRTTFSLVLGILVHGWMITAACFIEDLYALIAAVAVTINTLTRIAVLRLHRASLNRAAIDGMVKSDSKVKVLVELPDGKMVTVHTTSSIVVAGLVAEHPPHNQSLYTLLRMISYIALGLFVYTVGNALLQMQVVIILPTSIFSILAAKRVGFVDNRVGKYISIDRQKFDGAESRARMYAELQLDGEEEEVMTSWHLFPQKANRTWWDAYGKFCDEFERDSKAFDKWPDYMAVRR